ncbi:MAG: 1-acyl-sn-glycerol-3-phosphate acyltransferase [Oleiphilaceae bacterium]|jgi:1-acyl-sn-glycerol-3-phosphate acyltransferase
MNSQTKLTSLSSELPWQESFKDIQCYVDDQVTEVLGRLVSDSQFTSSLLTLFGASHSLINQLSELDNIDTIEEFQNWIEKRIFPFIASTYEQFSVSGLGNLDKKQSYIFISNHRDIVMDPLLLNQALRSEGFSTANCAIGDNLLKHPSANDLALLNRCFKIFRSLKSPRAVLSAMKNQSAYIQFLHFSRIENIWIAQKEGRAKDNIDKTNPALIKMLGLSKPSDYSTEQYYELLNIVPVCFSYEWDPCDIDKARQLNNQQDDQNYQKDTLDDLIATQKGLKGNKGRIHLHFGNPIVGGKTTENDEIKVLNHKIIAQEVDQVIQQNYKAYPVNFAAYKKIQGIAHESCPFDQQEVNNALKELELRLESCSSEVARRVYAAYAQVLL